MTESVSYVGNQIVVDPRDVNVAILVFNLLFQNFAKFFIFCHHIVNGFDSELNNVDILHFVVSTNVVNLSYMTFTNHHVNSFAVVFYVQPVADI